MGSQNKSGHNPCERQAKNAETVTGGQAEASFGHDNSSTHQSLGMSTSPGLSEELLSASQRPSCHQPTWSPFPGLTHLACPHLHSFNQLLTVDISKEECASPAPSRLLHCQEPETSGAEDHSQCERSATLRVSRAFPLPTAPWEREVKAMRTRSDLKAGQQRLRPIGCSSARASMVMTVLTLRGEGMCDHFRRLTCIPQIVWMSYNPNLQTQYSQTLGSDPLQASCTSPRKRACFPLDT
ncbi:PREDICTED: uncharacterized protein LOC108520508 [Rhinopithecus bieti]|uniref:uncharacterized protein LOC108520508 n=1 Tax=Rhinopithecus bieti TaxID=61621 RepID=UPI00083C18EC|nr:PREDICTED: uncharacterized protein LOC108520508 [Rhinopithecus bieti]